MIQVGATRQVCPFPRSFVPFYPLPFSSILIPTPLINVPFSAPGHSITAPQHHSILIPYFHPAPFALPPLLESHFFWSSESTSIRGTIQIRPAGSPRLTRASLNTPQRAPAPLSASSVPWYVLQAHQSEPIAAFLQQLPVFCGGPDRTKGFSSNHG
jgi:hypothetical protein